MSCLQTPINSLAMMKLVMMITLLLCDADVLFSSFSYDERLLAFALVSLVTLIYLLGTVLGNHQNTKVSMAANDLGDKFYQQRNNCIPNDMKWMHHVPFLRLARFGWMADVPDRDFAGIINANALYSSTIGMSQLVSSLFFIYWNQGQRKKSVKKALEKQSKSAQRAQWKSAQREEIRRQGKGFPRRHKGY